MRIALIDLGAAPVADLQSLAAKHELLPLEGQMALQAFADDYGGVVLVGSYGSDEASDQYIPQLAEAVRATTVPVLGIGRGFEVICAANDVDLATVAEFEIAATKIIPTNDGAKIFQGSDPMSVRQAERWWVEELPKSLQVLARSETGIEAIRHKQRPMMALQLNLDDFVYVSDGKLVIKNLLGLFGRV